MSVMSIFPLCRVAYSGIIVIGCVVVFGAGAETSGVSPPLLGGVGSGSSSGLLVVVSRVFPKIIIWSRTLSPVSLLTA